MQIGYHASHEQFSPRELLTYIRLAEDAGFDSVMSSDHITPWSERQGNSGHAWTWLGAALQATSSLTFGSLAIPGGSRYHPAVLAQAIATLCNLFPGRVPWIAAGSGEAMNEAVTGEAWPDKTQRDARLRQGVDFMRRLWSGEEVTNLEGPLKMSRARLWIDTPTRPDIYIAALSNDTAAENAEWADGLITVRRPDEELAKMLDAFRRSGGDGKPLVLQFQLSWAETREKAQYQAWDQWRNIALDPAQRANLRTPEEFDAACAHVTPEQIGGLMYMPDTADDLIRQLRIYKDMGFTAVYLHNAGRNQMEFIQSLGDSVLPALRR